MLALRRAQGGKVVLVQRRAGPARGPEVNGAILAWSTGQVSRVVPSRGDGLGIVYWHGHGHGTVPY